MKPSLSLRMSQHLALTPQLQQSIRLLQLSTIELNQELEQILADNPLLERVDDPMASALHVSSDGALYTERPALASLDNAAPAPAEARDAPADTPDAGAESDGDFGNTDYAADYGRPNQDDDDTRPQLGEDGVSLRDHLFEQLRCEKLGLRERALIAILIDSLDDDGYLHTCEEDIVAMLPSSFGLEPGELDEAIEVLQSFDPAGVGARSIAECLCLQLSADSDLVEESAPAIVDVAYRICAEHLALLAARDVTKLRKVLNCDDSQLRAAHALIKRLNPYPGSAFAKHESSYVVPDIVVRRIKGEWVATLNADVIPKLRINELYASVLKSNRNHGSAKPAAGQVAETRNAAMTTQLQEARWLIKNVQQRFDTILRVAQAIVDRQRGFFTHGEVAMRPLVLREIADILGLHESTVSRVTTQKFMLTPFGTFELKYFFGSHVATETGGAASSTAIRALIKQLIGAENPTEPLSDSKLAEMLGEQGIVVARRTVAKYREALKIPPVNLRKAL